MDIKKLIDFKINAAYARTSILGFIEILRSKGDGYAKPGEESNDLGIQDDGIQSLSQTRQTTLNNRSESMKAVQEQDNGGHLYTLPHPGPVPTQSRLQNPSRPSSSLSQLTADLQFAQEQCQQEQQPQAELLYALAPHELNPLGTEQRSLDVCHPFFDPAMLDLFPDGEMPDLPQFETSQPSLDYFELEDWNMTSTNP